jgi:hypothetical protein
VVPGGIHNSDRVKRYSCCTSFDASVSEETGIHRSIDSTTGLLFTPGHWYYFAVVFADLGGGSRNRHLSSVVVAHANNGSSGLIRRNIMAYRVRINHKIVFALILALMVGSLSLILYLGRSSQASKQEVPVVFSNETESLQITSFKAVNNKLELRLKNVSDQTIVAYHIDLKDQKAIAEDLTYGNELAAGHEFTLSIPFHSLPRDVEKGLHKLNLAMVMFGDGAAEGDWGKAQNWREQLQGAAVLFEEMQPRVAGIERLSREGVEQLSNQFEAKIKQPVKGLTRMQAAGYYRAALNTQMQIKQVLQGNSMITSKPMTTDNAVAKFQNRFERQAANVRNLSHGRKSR